jgi:hypothetical protein
MNTATISKTKITTEKNKVNLIPASIFLKQLKYTVKEISIENIQKILSKYKGNLSKEVIRLRNKERF